MTPEDAFKLQLLESMGNVADDFFSP